MLLVSALLLLIHNIPAMLSILEKDFQKAIDSCLAFIEHIDVNNG